MILVHLTSTTNHCKAEIDDTGVARRRANSAMLTSSESGRPISQQSKHNRASSDHTLLKGFPTPPGSSTRGHHAAARFSTGSSKMTGIRESLTPPLHAAPPVSLPSNLQDNGKYSSEDPITGVAGSGIGRRPTTSGYSRQSFFDAEESDADSLYRHTDDIPILQRTDETVADKTGKVLGVTFDDLVDRLLSQSMSKADTNFSYIFLCLYRKFAAPAELFSAILDRLEHNMEDKGVHSLFRIGIQLRIVEVIVTWVSNYPGDFASLRTRQLLDDLIGYLAGEPMFVPAAYELQHQFQFFVHADDDTGWARTDAGVDDTVFIPRRFLAVASIKNNNRQAGGSFVKDVGNLRIDDETSERMDRRISKSSSQGSVGAKSATNSVIPSLHTFEEYEREAAQLVPTSSLPLTKFRYHIFMDTSDDAIAEEMTRIDWVMFSSIRLRDLIRHVSLNSAQREKCKSLVSVDRMIGHFNHIARWVSNLILMRDKPKHRAQMLEKFMRIALRLRQLNNYNGLGAVIAGIKSTAVHRLAQTFALISPESQKKFMTLEILMGNQKSHFSYRLAWENSPYPRIPFIPLHRRDLVSSEEGSRTFVGPDEDRINWKKFEVLMEVLLPIMKSQLTPYPNLVRHDIARELILDCRMPTDEEVSAKELSIEKHRFTNIIVGNLPAERAVRKHGGQQQRGFWEEVSLVLKVNYGRIGGAHIGCDQVESRCPAI